jgi:hypothetical protein
VRSADEKARLLERHADSIGRYLILSHHYLFLLILRGPNLYSVGLVN